MDQDKYLPELLAEKESLDSSFVHAMRLLAEGNRISLSLLSLCITLTRYALLGIDHALFLSYHAIVIGDIIIL